MSETTGPSLWPSLDDEHSSVQFSRLGNSSQSAAPIKFSATAEVRNDLVTFLAVVQRNRLDLLPFTWSPTLDTSFAFKRFWPPMGMSSEDTFFRVLVSEISVLGHPLVKTHPNILALYGICWDVLPEGMVWPVLVFEKASMGNLKEFIRSDEGKSITFADKLKICADVSAGIRDMHSSNIIHGDIKPENILISKTEDSAAYVAQVTDFGYSTMHTDHLIHMPRSRGWNAPEWHHRGFTYRDAEKMDVYSFGLLCLWLFFFDELEYISDLFRVKVPAIVDELLSAETKQAVDLKRVLRLSLESNPASRPTFSFLSKLLESTSEPISLPQQNNFETSESCGRFALATSITELYDTDYRVRTKIRDTLHKRACDTYSNPDDHQNDAFQLAMCYAMGFGAPMDREKASLYLRASMQSQEMLDMEIDHAKNSYASSLNYQSEKLQVLRQERVIQYGDFIDQYLQQRTIAEAEKVCRRELTDLCSVLGTASYLTGRLRQEMATITSAMGRWSEAEDFLLQAMQSMHGLKSAGTYICDMLLVLAKLYYSQERYSEAEELYSDILQNKLQSLPAENLRRLSIIASLAAVYRSQGRLNIAEEWYTQLMRIHSRLLGIEHVVTLADMGGLAYVLQDQGRWSEAEDLLRRQIELLSKHFGATHSRTQLSLSNLAVVFEKQGRWQEAKALGVQILNTSIATLGTDHPRTLARSSNLAVTLDHQGLWEEAEKLYLRCVEASRKDLGSDHLTTLVYMGNLASLYHKQGRYHDAEQLERSVLEGRQSNLGRGHPDTLISMSNLASTYYVQGKLNEAEALEVEVLKTSCDKLGKHHPNTLTATSDLATTYIHQNKWTEAGTMLEEAAASSKQVLGPEHPETLSTLDKLGSVYCHQARWAEAEDLFSQNMQVKTRLFGAKHPSTLDSTLDLAVTYRGRDKMVESLELHRRVLALRIEVLGEDHPDTRASYRFVSGDRVKLFTRHF
ncbi:MAG: hypothetical protein ASARMPRED_001618 [Alectoria sarmentosa]|nr:MAG: hypothetical protein ASARMPRED_001618 [Alectoria sarmentosa]